MVTASSPLQLPAQEGGTAVGEPLGTAVGEPLGAAVAVTVALVAVVTVGVADGSGAGIAFRPLKRTATSGASAWSAAGP